VFTFVLDGLKGSYEVAFVINGIENAEDVNAAVSGVVNKGDNYVISIITVADQVLSAQEHLQSGIRHQLL
jgi:hypothetical protein